MSSRRARALITGIVVTFAAAGVVTACASDGRALRDPAPGATTLPLPPTTVPAGGAAVGDGAVIGTASVARTLVLATTDFADGQAMPSALSCDGAQPSAPALTWTGVADGTAELAISVVDPDAGGFVHWAVAGIPAGVRSLAAGQVPEGAAVLTNDAGVAGWSGPCPPPGAKPHRYIFTLYALGKASGLVAGSSARDGLTALSADTFDTATLAGTYQR